MSVFLNLLSVGSPALLLVALVIMIWRPRELAQLILSLFAVLPRNARPRSDRALDGLRALGGDADDHEREVPAKPSQPKRLPPGTPT